MIYLLDKICGDLAALLGEGGFQGDIPPLEQEWTGTPLHRYAVLCIPDYAAREILRHSGELAGNRTLAQGAVWESASAGYLPLPADFLKLADFSVEGLTRMRYRVEGGMLKFYGQSIPGEMVHGVNVSYISRPEFDRFGGIDMPQEVYLPTLEAVAGILRQDT